MPTILWQDHSDVKMKTLKEWKLLEQSLANSLINSVGARCDACKAVRRDNIPC